MSLDFNVLKRILVFKIFLVSVLVVAKNDEKSQTGNPVDTKEEIKAYIEHHLQDSHDFVLYTDGKTGKHIGFSLPIILWDDGLQIFSSSKFHHGETVAEVNGNYYKLYHEKIYKTDASGTLTFDEKNHPTNKRPLDFSITKSVLGMILVGLLMLLIFSALARNYKKSSVPTGFSRILEPIVLYVRDEIARPNIGEKKYRKYMGFLLTVFFYIWISNLFGLTPFGFNITGQIAVTVCLAVFTFIIVQFSGSKDYWKHIFWMPGVPVIMKIILMPIEILGMFTKPFSLLIRLFANITAGHFVVMSLIALMITMKAAFGAVASTGVSLVLSLFITVIELLVAFLQAFIFTMLSALFIGMAVEEHDHEHAHDGNVHGLEDNSIV
ncbi:F0F1 ATP synthase subunit A [Aquimarina sp. ERC-38]|uniref:F0F1 ATP synthase subunit A n=1 Tax=Aquimarina sp. ERC-38 TaxID=2949996 RepID=UPI0022450F95|nr:F0F1 ATP synthase subunit A [Aquimarina sp. ERC-38]UZO81672.1 F0F1 ATP synthase subunit A [Aquimarina sp. ERC-38]